MTRLSAFLVATAALALVAVLPDPVFAGKRSGYVEGGYGLGWYGGRPYYYRPFGVYGGKPSYKRPYASKRSYRHRPFRYRF
jgi:hypothetical protein